MSIHNSHQPTAATIYAPLHLAPYFSWYHSIVLILIYLAAILAIILLSIQMLIKFIFISIVLIIAWKEISLHILRTSSSAIIEAIWDQNGEWTLKLVSGQIVSATLLGDSLVTPFLIVLNFHLSFLSRQQFNFNSL